MVYITNGNHTPGSWSYSDLVDTWADSVCIHQLLLNPWSKAVCIIRRQAAAYGSFQLMHSSSQDTLRIGYTSLFTR